VRARELPPFGSWLVAMYSLLMAASATASASSAKRSLAVRNVSVKVAEKIQYEHFEPATFRHIWLEIEFHLANVSSKPVVLKSFRTYYRLPSDWRLSATSPGFGFDHTAHFLYSIDLGTIAPGHSMHRKQRIAVEPSFPAFDKIKELNLRTLKASEYPIALTWRVAYLVGGDEHRRRWCWMVEYRSTLPGRCSSLR
jgi:hypothetical protein